MAEELKHLRHCYSTENTLNVTGVPKNVYLFDLM